jgi:hypothetical protein
VRRPFVVWTLIALPSLALIVWIASNTTWVDVPIPMPLKGDARVNPFYAAQRFAAALGARTTWDRTLQVPDSNAVIVLSAWHWNLSESRRAALERWVESGGRLVVDDSVLGDHAFSTWSGIVLEDRANTRAEMDEVGFKPVSGRDLGCRDFEMRMDERGVNGPTPAKYRLCIFNRDQILTTKKSALWTIGDAAGAQAVRVMVGRGHVTAINAEPFTWTRLFFGDHGSLFVTAAELRGGDVIHFLSEAEHPSLLALTWQYGAPLVVCCAVILGLGVWRGGVRFGPLAPDVDGARRSLAEQIRGTGHFAARHESGDALHAACVRALDEAVEKRLPGYRRLAGRERAEALARLTGFDRDALMTAIYHPRLRRDHELASAIALIEAARRRAHPLSATGSLHGTS